MLPVGNWSVHIGVPRDVFMAPLRRSLWLIGIGLAVTLLLAVIFLWLLLREIKLRRQEELGMEAVRRLEALGRMTGGVAHDFNNLLMIMQGSAEGIKRRVADQERRQAYADAILAAVQRGQSLTRQLLAFAQRGAHEPVSFRIQDRASELKDLLSRSVRENVEVRLSVPADTWPVRADPNALEVALINLAVNASDAMPKGGPVSITASNVILTGGREGEPALEGSFVAIAVQDAGTGIEPEHIDRIFEPFFTTKGQGKGTGLGLSQVYGFAQQSGGAITVKGRPGQGSTFTLFLPRALQTPVAPGSPAQAQMGNNKGRILLVEDNLPVAEVTAAMLSDAGYEVTRSASASAALNLLKARRDFDVILSDIVMEEGISGLDLARHVRKTWPELPLVLMTGYSEALKRANLSGVPYVFKPFTQQEILAALVLVRRPREATADQAPR
jgi:two-component system NtrC family sensor kinase